MNTRKIFAFSLLTNLLVLGALVGVFVFTQTAQAHAPAAVPAAPALAGPFYYSLTSFDFTPLDATFNAFNRNGFGMYRASNTPDYAVAPLHLPAGAQLSELDLDADDNTTEGSVSVFIQTCDVGRVGCDTQGSLVTSLDGGRKALGTPLNFVVNNTNQALIAVARFDGNYSTATDVTLYFVRIVYLLPASTFLPAVLH